jgi:hypothetical protein
MCCVSYIAEFRFFDGAIILDPIIILNFIIPWIQMIPLVHRCECIPANPIRRTLVGTHVWWILHKPYTCVKWTVTSYTHVVFHAEINFSMYNGSLSSSCHSINMPHIQAIRNESEPIRKPIAMQQLKFNLCMNIFSLFSFTNVRICHGY